MDFEIWVQVPVAVSSVVRRMMIPPEQNQCSEINRRDKIRAIKYAFLEGTSN